ncbi:MAG: HAD-IC family P-type ATPase, partial [Anaerolineae bacterium]
MSTYQEVRSKRQLDKIALLTRPQVTVIREGQEKVVDPAELVSGDIFRVRPGDQIVVDGIVIGDSKVEVDESLLTGESDLIRKQEGDTLLSGSFCVTGSALGQAEKVGADSFANQLTVTASAFQITKTPLQSKIDFVIRTMMLIALLMGLVIFAAAILENLPFIRMVQIAAVITGQIPYGLFLMIIVAYALGAVQIARQGALVQQVNAIESLSNVDVLCMDKTGTLTANRINYHDLYPLSHTETNISEEILEQLLGSFARSAAVTNPTSEAIVAG